MKTTIIYILILTLIVSCTSEPEEKTTIVSGIVINKGSIKPIEGIEVFLIDGIGSSGFTLINSQTTSGKETKVITNSKGEFVIEITGIYTPFLSVAPPLGYDWWLYEGVGVRGFKPGSTNEGIVLEMIAYAQFCGIFKAKYPADSLKIDILDYNDINKSHIFPLSYKNVCSDGKACIKADKPFYMCGELGDDIFYHEGEIGDKYLRFKLYIKRNNIWQSKIDSVYLKGFETYRDTIYY